MRSEVKHFGALGYVKDYDFKDFDEMFCSVCGYVGNEAKKDPGALYLASSVAELFNRLLEKRIQDSETPAAGTAGESGRSL